MNFFGGEFFAGGFFGENATTPQQIVFVGGGGEAETWRERVALRMRERNAERLLKKKRIELRKVERQLERIEAKTAELPAGVLYAPEKFVKLAVRRDEVAAEVASAEIRLQGIELALAAFEIDRDDEEILLFL